MARRQLSAAQKWQVIGMSNSGRSTRNIANHVGGNTCAAYCKNTAPLLVSVNVHQDLEQRPLAMTGPLHGLREELLWHLDVSFVVNGGFQKEYLFEP